MVIMENHKYSDVVEKQTIFQKLNSTFTLEYKGEKIEAIRNIPADYEYGREEETIIDEHGIVFNNNGNVVFISPSARSSKIYEEGKNVKK